MEKLALALWLLLCCMLLGWYGFAMVGGCIILFIIIGIIKCYYDDYQFKKREEERKLKKQKRLTGS